MTFAELVDRVALRFATKRLRRGRLEKIIKATFRYVGLVALDGERVAIPKFGSFRIQKRKSTTVRHPVSGEPMQLPEDERVAFRASKHLRRRTR